MGERERIIYLRTNGNGFHRRKTAVDEQKETKRTKSEPSRMIIVEIFNRHSRIKVFVSIVPFCKDTVTSPSDPPF